MDIEAMAREAGEDAWDVWRDGRGALCVGLDGISLTEELEKFAELVAAAEREACWREAENHDTGSQAAHAIRMRSNAQGKPTAANEPNEGENT